MRAVKVVLTLLVPSAVFALTPLWSYVVLGRYSLSFNANFLWAASALLGGAALTALCRPLRNRPWRDTAARVGVATALLVPCSALLYATGVITLGEIPVEPILVLGLHLACAASAAWLCRLNTKPLLVVFAAAVLLAAAIHTRQYGLVRAAEAGDAWRVGLILRAFPDHAGKGDALFASALHAHGAVVRLLLDGGANPNYVQPTSGWTPLHAVCSGALFVGRGAHDPIRDILLERGADVNARDRSGRTPLFYAAAESMRNVKWLLEHGADIGARDRFGATCILYAVPHCANDTARIEYLAAHGADLHGTDSRGHTVMHYLASNEHFVADEMLDFLKARGFDINARDADGATPLHVAVGRGIPPSPIAPSEWYGDVHVAETLLDHGADINARDAEGRTPLHHLAAYNAGNTALLKFLLAWGADADLRDVAGKTPLAVAVDRGNRAIINVLTRYTGRPETAGTAAPLTPAQAQPTPTVAAAAAGAPSAPAAASEPAAPPPPSPAAPAPTVDLVEASGICVRGGGKVAVVAGDETMDRLWGVSLEDFAVRWELPFPSDTPYLDDIEALAPWGDDGIFVTCSQSRTKPSGKQRTPRERFALLTLSPDAKKIVSARVYSGLRERLIEYLQGPMQDLFENPTAIGMNRPNEGGLNVEGLAVWKDALLVGLRSPLARGGAVVVPIRKPEGLFESGAGEAAPDFGKPWVLPAAAGEGIRDMAAVKDGILVLLGSPTDTPEPPFRLVLWNPETNELKEVRPKGLKDIPNPEGIALDPQGRLLVVQDQKPPIRQEVFFRFEMTAP